MAVLSKAQVLAPKRRSILPQLLLMLCIVGLAASGWLAIQQSAQVERILVLIQPVQYGHQISQEALGWVEVPKHRAQPILTGITDPAQVVGRWASRDLYTNDVLSSVDLLSNPPDQAIYPGGPLGKDKVGHPFPVAGLLVRSHDVINLGYNDASGDPTRCTQQGGLLVSTVPPVVEAVETQPQAEAQPQPYACRLVSQIPVLYVDEAGMAHLELTPEQALALEAIRAAGLTMWAERYNASSTPLQPLERRDITQFDPQRLQAQPTTTALPPPTPMVGR